MTTLQKAHAKCQTGNTQICQRQTLLRADDEWSVELSDTARNDLVKAAEGKDNHLREKEEEEVAPAVKEEAR